LVTELTTEFAAKKILLEEKEALLKEEKNKLKEDKQAITRVQSTNHDIVSLNVGGKIFATKRESLRLVICH